MDADSEDGNCNNLINMIKYMAYLRCVLQGRCAFLRL